MTRRSRQDTPATVDAFLAGTLFAGGDAELEAALARADAAGLPRIEVSLPQARLLEVLCRTVGARRILEFGTLAGYSTIAMARTLPDDGRLITLEYDPSRAAVARENFERAGLADRIDLRVGAALDTLPLLEAEGAARFDFVFIDADKSNTATYFAWALDRCRPGALLFADNSIRRGLIVEPEPDATSSALRDFQAYLADEPRVSATTIQTVGAKGHDGFTLAVVLDHD